MARLEDLATGTHVTGLTGSATVDSAQWIGEQGLKVIIRDSDGHLGERFVYRDDEPSKEPVEMDRPWSFDGDGDPLRLVSGAYRINLAWLFAPYVAGTTSASSSRPPSSILTTSTASAVTALSCHQEKTDNMTRPQCH